jgi:glutathione synthase/RimK-type ligase-like ATP-grasp enzyme
MSEYRMKPRIALVSARDALPLDEDMPPLVSALQGTGFEVETPAWDDASVDWHRYQLAVLRSTWDYVERLDEFLSWADSCGRATRLENPPAIVRWNTDKHYLNDLARAGVPVVATNFVEPGADPATALSMFLSGHQPTDAGAGSGPDFDEFVVKPTVGAGSRDTARYGRAEVERARTHVERLLEAGRSAMLQPYLRSVDAAGETAVIYLGGSYSHAVRKGPLLKPGTGFVEGLFAPEEIGPRTPGRDELDVAARAYRAIGDVGPVYARIDLVRDGSNRPVVLELELTEPSLFLSHAPDSAGRFARALASRIRS